MAIQYNDDTFSENLPANEALKRFTEEFNAGDEPLKALHLGTPSELEEIKAKQTELEEFCKIKAKQKLDEQIDELKAKMNEIIEKESPVKDSLIVKATKDDIKKYIGEYLK